MTYQQRQLLRYEPSYEGGPRESPLRQNYDPGYSNTSPRPNYQQYPTNQRPPPQQQQQQQYQYPSDDRIYNRSRPRHGDIRGYEPDSYQPKKFDYQYDDRFHRPVKEHMHQQQQQHQRERMFDQESDIVRSFDEHGHFQQHVRKGNHDHHQQQEQRGHYDHHQQHEQRGYPDHHQQHEHRGYHDYDQHHQHQYLHDQRHIMQPAGRANNYSTKITDLLTSVKDPQQKDDSMVKAMEENKGYLVMMRFRPKDMNEIVTAIQENVSTLTSHHGYVIGFADPSDMQIIMPSNQMMADNQWWNRSQGAQSAVCCFWFKDINQAKRWFESAGRIKQPDFPNSNPYQAVAVPLTYGHKATLPFGPKQQSVTLLWSEYPNVRERFHNDFMDNYSTPAYNVMKEYGANPYVSISQFKAGWGNEPNKFGQPEYTHINAKKERVARAIHHGWLTPNTFITVSTFPSMGSVFDFYGSGANQDILSRLNRYTDPVFVALRLKKVKGTTRH